MAEITILDEPDRAVFRDSKILSCNRAKPSSECGCASVRVCVCVFCTRRRIELERKLGEHQGDAPRAQ